MHKMDGEMKRKLDEVLIKREAEDAILFKKAKNGDVSILSDPRVAETFDDLRLWTPLHWIADAGCEEVLKHPLVSVVRVGIFGRPDDLETPLHRLAIRGIAAVITHQDVATVKDEHGNTPLHALARAGIKDQSPAITQAVWNHPDVAKTKDRDGKTPADMLTEAGIVRPAGVPEPKKPQEKEIGS